MMHQRISKKIITYILIFFILVTITNYKLSSNFYIIKNLNINGLNKIETEKIYNELLVFKDTNIFSFDKKNISQRIYSNNIVEEFKIYKIYPSTLNIDIKKTKFLAITNKNNDNYLVGSNGKLIEMKNTSLDLPYIFGNINVNNFLNFKKIIDKSKLDFNEIKELYYFKSNRWDIVTKNGLTIKMPNKLDKKKLDYILNIITKDNFKDIKIIDFRQKSMMVINE